MTSFASRRQRVLVIASLLSAMVITQLVIDARWRVTRGEIDAALGTRIVRVTGLSELALSTSSTWLRHPALAAPSAGASDAPLGLDVDPAGAVIPRHGRERTIEMVRQ